MSSQRLDFMVQYAEFLRAGKFSLDFCGNKTASDTLHLYCVGNALRID
jgi:hypothetical protein